MNRRRLDVASPLYLILVCLGCWSLALSAPSSTNAPLPYATRTWQTDEGLPHNEVHAITQTQDGFLWVGTKEGLARFDGIRFTAIDDRQAPELRRGSISALCASRDGSLWVACEGHGLCRLKNGAWTHFTETNGLASSTNSCLLEARDSTLWVGAREGLARFTNGVFIRVQQPLQVRGLCEDRTGTLRVATQQGLSRLNQNGIIGTIRPGAGYSGNALRFVCEDSHGALWVGSNDGLTQIDGAKYIFYGKKDGLPGAVINTAFEDHEGQLWVGTYGGLARIVDGEIIARRSPDPIFSDLIFTIFLDREENLWVGGRDGLYRLNPARFTCYSQQQGLTQNNVMSVCEDTSDGLWVATWGGGLNLIRDNKITTFGNTNGLTNDKLLSLCEARDGSLWIGLEYPPGGLNRFSKDAYQNCFPKLNDAPNSQVIVIHEDRQGDLWLGTDAGLKLWRNGGFETFTAANGLAGNIVQALSEDNSGKLWIACQGGLTCRENSHFTRYTTKEGLSHNAVDALYVDQDQTLWIGTRAGGVNRLRGGKLTAYTTRQGLFSDEVYEILEDNFGYFWMTCRKGLFKVARKDFDELDRGARKSLACTAFGKPDGLLTVQFNGSAKPGGWKSRDGRLWFPTIRGVVAVDTRIKTNEKPPPVLIEEIMADRKIVAAAGADGRTASAVTIPAGRGELEVRFTALSLQAPEKNAFKYMVEEMDPAWIEAGTERTARYTHVPPGQYHFRVIACNNDGIWNETGASLALIFLPHFWQTWTFKAACVAAAGLTLAVLYRLRVARLRAIERLRIQIAANLHDDVGARLTKVAMVTESMQREPPVVERIKPYVQTISQTTSEIIQAMDEIVWTINPKNDTLDHLANYVFQYAQEYFEDTGVQCRLDLPAQLPNWTMSTESRHNLFMAVKEALNNVLKHAQASEVRITLSTSGSATTIIIADNGCGFSPRAASKSGNGLENMRRRLDQIGGRFVLETEPGKGTTIRMEARGG
ncbi:MAG: hypothetical protein C5B50_29920 [Verrucomicrobia bacterium]|nr:MAG: hypothetical protein C5B50_29920 [Verrucomicrobiota bacterium]